MYESASRRFFYSALAAAFFANLLTTGASAQVRILQTNSLDSTVHLIDPATNRIVGEIDGIPVNHGVVAAPDAARGKLRSVVRTIAVFGAYSAIAEAR